MRLSPLIRTTLVFLVVLVPGPAAAAPSIYQRVLGAYQADGSIPPCQFTSAQLQQALKGVDTYGQQYFADFTNAIQNALAARASGTCAPGPARNPAPTPSPAASRFVPPSPTGPTQAGLPAPMLILAGLALAGACLLLLAAVGRARGWDPRFLTWLRHGMGDARYRAADALDRRAARRR